ncbi:MAG: hypothetical protein P8Y48_12695 [Novosphingobium sp.]
MLGLLQTADKPVSAYEIADMARASGVSLVPNQVYRTVGRLLKQQRARRIETLNAYLPWTSAADLCLVCAQCHRVELIALSSLGAALTRAIADTGFHPSTFVVELLGRCPRCQLDGTPA